MAAWCFLLCMATLPACLPAHSCQSGLVIPEIAILSSCLPVHAVRGEKNLAFLCMPCERKLVYFANTLSPQLVRNADPPRQF